MIQGSRVRVAPLPFIFLQFTRFFLYLKVFPAAGNTCTENRETAGAQANTGKSCTGSRYSICSARVKNSRKRSKKSKKTYIEKFAKFALKKFANFKLSIEFEVCANSLHPWKHYFLHSIKRHGIVTLLTCFYM